MTAPQAPCRIALLGCGAISELFYAPALKLLAREGLAVPVAFFDRDPARVAELRRHFPNATGHGDESFLEKEAIDLTIVASPAPFHAAQTIRALEAGHAVLCEKPMAVTTAEAERMIAVSRTQNRLLAVGLFRRFYPTVAYVRNLVAEGALGPLRRFSIREGGAFSWPARSDSFFRKATAGGGVLLDIGIHVLDLVIHWFGEPDHFTYQDDAMGGVEANCRIDLRYGNAPGEIVLSRDWAAASRYRLEFERGVVTFAPGEPDRLTVQLHGSPLALEGALREARGAVSLPGMNSQQSFVAQLRDVIEAVQTGRLPAVPGEEAIRSLRLIEACYARRTLLDLPWFSPEEMTAGRQLVAGGCP